MPRPRSSRLAGCRRRTALVAALVLPALVGGALHAGNAAAAGATAAGSPATLQSGSTPQTRPFPDDTFTVADAMQATGRRIALPTAGCDSAGRTLCDQLALLNTLDGFDVRPRVTLPFSAPVDLHTITPDTVRIEGPNGFRTRLVQLVLDPVTGTVAGQPADYLAPATTYTLVVSPGIRTALGGPVDVCPDSSCRFGDQSRRTPFTTLSSTAGLDAIRVALDNASAYQAAGIAPGEERMLRFDTADDGARSVFPGSATATVITRTDQTRADGTGATPRTVLNSAKTYAYYGIGSITSPQYLRPDVQIAPAPTGRTPAPVGKARLSVVMLAPAPSATCMKPVIFGHGFGGSNLDVLRAADTLGQSNLAVFATDVPGHGFGPASTYTVTAGGTTRSGALLGRGRDLDGNGTIDSSEGVVAGGSNNILGSRDALIQAVVDNMTLTRALERGVDVDGDGTVDTCAGPGVVGFYGQSFGGIYGTILLGTDPAVTQGVPNVAGGPVAEVTRLGFFRALLALNLATSSPALRNGPPGLYGFTESLPLRRHPLVSDPQQGAVPIQELLARTAWLQRSGSPESYAPRLNAGARFGSKKVLFQIAYGDGTVPNPTSSELLRAGNLYDRAWVYRNDRTPNAANNPHGFLLDVFLPAHFEGQEQIRRFLFNGEVRDPDTPQQNTWEPVVAQAGSTPSTDYRVQLDCLHFPDPQTGGQPVPPDVPAVDCTDRSAQVSDPRPPARDRFVGLPSPLRVLDTRDGTGAPKGAASGRLRLDLAKVVADPGATAVVLNVTALNASRPGYVVAFPAGAPVPPTSNVNVEAAVPGVRANTQANEAVVRLSQDRAVDLLVQNTSAQVVVDVVGYLSPNAPAGGRITALPAQRLLDTRTTAEPLRTGAVTLDLAGTTAAGAAAVLLNVTATRPAARGYVTAYPSGTEKPGTSNVNVEAGQTQANAVLVRVGDDGKVVLDPSVATALVVDLVGRVEPAASTAGAEYRALDAPRRVLDTRSGLGGPIGRVGGRVDLTLPTVVPTGAVGVVLNVTAVNGDRPGYVTVFPTGAAVPGTSNVNFGVRVPQANEVLTGVTNGSVSLQVGGARSPRTHLVVDVVGYLTAPPAAPPA